MQVRRHAHMQEGRMTDRHPHPHRQIDTDRQTDRQTDIGFVASKPNYKPYYHQGHFKVQKDFNSISNFLGKMQKCEKIKKD